MKNDQLLICLDITDSGVNVFSCLSSNEGICGSCDSSAHDTVHPSTSSLPRYSPPPSYERAQDEYRKRFNRPPEGENSQTPVTSSNVPPSANLIVSSALTTSEIELRAQFGSRLLEPVFVNSQGKQRPQNYSQFRKFP